MDYQDYYATLGVDKKASQDDIQKAYRKLARKFHPDVNQDAGAEDRFKSITEAYEVLKDPDKRQQYDRFGSAWKQRGGPPPGWDGVRVDFGGGGASGFSDFFDALFGGGRQARGGGSPFGGRGGSPFGGFRGGRPNLDQRLTLALTLEEAAKGGQRQINVRDPQSRQTRTLSVNLPPGLRAGRKLRLPGKGLADPSGQKGSLFLEIDLRPHKHFRLDGNDLHTRLPVTPWLAALGGEASVKTLDGTVRVRVPAGSSTGRKIRLKGKGFPDAAGAGDLYATIEVMVPESLDEAERELFEQLAEVSDFKAR
ncbi:MAG: DnaJ C-terminal domain-containing protein [Acidobacteriota bacterium]